MIGRSGERESGISVLAARHDDDDYERPVKRALKNTGNVYGYLLSISNRLTSPSGQSIRQWSGRPGFNPISRHTKDFKNDT